MKLLRKGFTLIELMVVVSIIIILASLAVPSFVKYREVSYTAKCVANLRAVQDAREAYFMDHDGVTELNAADTGFLQYLGEMTSSDESMVLVDEDMICCPYNGAKYTDMGCNISEIGTMPSCPNAASSDNPVAACAGHVYSGH